MRATCANIISAVLLMLIAVDAHAADPRPRQALPAPPALPPGVRLVPNLEYASPGGKSLLMDLYLPAAGDGPAPVIVFVHGGGWVGGDKRDGETAVGLIAHGYAVASINYRFSYEAVFPAQIFDCKAAVRWIRAHSKYYNLDSQHVGAWGASAGGHLVALLGTTGGVKELEGDEGNLDQSSAVQAVCDCFGPTDFLKISEEARAADPSTLLDADAPLSLVSRLIGAPIQQEREKTERANPITYIGKDAAPMLILHGDQDRLVPLAQSELLRDALEKNKIEVKLEVVRGAGHGFASDALFKEVMTFFDAHLRPTAVGRDGDPQPPHK